MNIKIFYENTTYRLKNRNKAVVLFKELLKSEGFTKGEINIIITTDEIIRPLNLKFLNHDYNTDVIAFNYDGENTLLGDIYISKDTVKRNSANYNVSLENEMLRVMIHGLLHLTGYNDKSVEEKQNMHRIEDNWLNRFNKEIDGI